MKIALIRHGETDWNVREVIQGQSDIPLNQTGLSQAGRVAGWLAENESWDRLYMSRLIRARQTAELIGNSLNLRPIMREHLMERDFGALEGLTVAEREQRYPSGREDETSVPGLELRQDFRERVVNSFESITSESVGLNIVIVSHGGWINQLLRHVSNGVIGSGITTLRNGGICLINNNNDNSWDLVEINFCGHLP